MRLNTLVRTLTILMMLLLMTAAVASAATVQEKRELIRKMRTETLQKLYDVHPTAKGAIQRAYGYAVFDNSDIQLGILGGGGGYGLAIINDTGGEIFMKTVEGSVGIGLGVKNYMLVFVFATQKAFADFASEGWEWGGQATAAATDGVNGDSEQGAVSVGSDVWVYQLTDKGLELTATIRGIRYFKNKELN
jgi:lipid-binding SYLF domain-containing protein